MSKSINRDYQLIETLSELKTVADLFKKEKAIAVDLEADSMYHFKEKVCLIQMATHDINVVIDPLKIHDLSPLKPLFENRSIKKIFHGADYDVRSLYRDFKININNLTADEAKLILEKINENIYGLDINPFATHISEINLLLLKILIFLP